MPPQAQAQAQAHVAPTRQPVRSTIKALASWALTSEALTRVEVALARWSGATAQVVMFHCPVDPHSHVLLQAVGECLARETWPVPIVVKVVPEQRGYQTESPAQQWKWALEDAVVASWPYRDWINVDALKKADPSKLLPDDVKRDAVVRAGAIAARAHGGNFIELPNVIRDLVALGNAVFGGATLPPVPADFVDPTPLLAQWEQDLRAAHYLSATLLWGRQIYWGVDRLAHLERELALRPRYNMNRPARGSVVANPHALIPQRAKILLFWSFRSPYSQLALKQVIDVSARTGARIDLRAVLPMVMRGLQVPLQKRLYIARDTAREARDVGVPYGYFVDPVGAPTERAFAALWVARRTGRELLLMQSWAEKVWASGVDAGCDDGLRAVCDAAGLEWADVREALASTQVDAEWRAWAEANRARLYALGLWGVPSFAVVTDDAHEAVLGPPVWGQDRVFAVEAVLRGAQL